MILKIDLSNIFYLKGVRSHPAVVKPVLTEEHRRLRREYVEKMSDWGANDWSKVIFMDEFGISTDDKGKPRVWRVRGERFDDSCIIEATKKTHNAFSFIVR